jgi:pimeloyl-ACP methyl ester carboxylesterase
MGELVYDRRGSGEPLVLVHGLGSRRQAWKPVMDLAAQARDVIAVDLPGFGESPPDRSGTELRVGDHADRVQEFFADLGLDRPHVAGSSLGGAIALELGRRQAVRSVTAFSPVGFWGAPGEAWCRWALRAGWESGRLRPASTSPRLVIASSRPFLFIYAFGRPWNAPDEEILETVESGLGAPGFRDALDYGLDYRFGDPQALDGLPVTVAWGRRDVLMPPLVQARRARRMLPRARHLSLPHCGHVPFYDNPELCTRVLLEGSRPSG